MYKIMIDPGHAPGNTNHGPGGYYEYAGMWKLSNYLKAALERCGFEAGLTRSENGNPELTARGECAKGCDLFISEHSNAGGGKGCECYFSVRIPKDNGFASDLAAAVSSALGDTSRGAKTWHSTINPAYDYLTVMGSAVYVGCPHVFLCENGFHDDAEDEEKLKSDEKLYEIAEAQARVICGYLQVTYIASSKKTTKTYVPVSNPDCQIKLGDKVMVKPGVTTFADGTGMASFIQTAVLYVRQIGGCKILVSTMADGAVTGWVRTSDLLYVSNGSAVLAPALVNSQSSAPASFDELKVGDRVHLRSGVTTFADGISMASFIRRAQLYVCYIGVNKVLISTQVDGPVTGWVKNEDVIKD